MKIIIFKTFDNPVEANIVRGLLLDHDIECFLKDENIVGLNPLYSNATGGIKLMLKEEDLEKASQIIEQTTENYKNEFKCPKCGSLEVNFITNKKNSTNWFSIALSFITLTYPIYLEKKYECTNCGNIFTLNDE